MSKKRNPYINVGARVTHYDAPTTEPRLDPEGNPILDDSGEQILVDVKPVVGTIIGIVWSKDEASVRWPESARGFDPWGIGRHNLWALRVAKS